MVGILIVCIGRDFGLVGLHVVEMFCDSMVIAMALSEIVACLCFCNSVRSCQIVVVIQLFQHLYFV